MMMMMIVLILSLLSLIMAERKRKRKAFGKREKLIESRYSSIIIIIMMPC